MSIRRFLRQARENTEMSDELLSRKPRLIRNCRLSDTPQQGEMILMPEGVIRLKGTGADIVKLCDGNRTLGEITAELKSKYQNSAQIEVDMMEFLNSLKEKRVMDF